MDPLEWIPGFPQGNPVSGTLTLLCLFLWGPRGPHFFCPSRVGCRVPALKGLRAPASNPFAASVHLSSGRRRGIDAANRCPARSSG